MVSAMLFTDIAINSFFLPADLLLPGVRPAQQHRRLEELNFMFVPPAKGGGMEIIMEIENYKDRIAETVFRHFTIEITETVFRQL